MAKGKNNKPSVRSRIKSGTDRFLAGAKPLEMGLFGLGGYYSGTVLNRTGLPHLLYTRGGLYRQWIDAAWSINGGGSNPNNPAGMGGGQVIAKTSGLAAFFYELARVGTGKSLGSAGENAILPFALGAMLDGPEGETSATSTIQAGARW